MPTKLELSILATIGYYNVLDMPITPFEIWRYRINIRSSDVQKLKTDTEPSADQKLDLYNILQILETSEFLKSKISQKNGFYFLKGRDNLYEKRIETQKIAEKKWKKLLKICYFLQAVPFIKLVMASGSLIFGNTQPKSDLDLLIVAKNGRIWTVRALVAFTILLLGARRTKTKTADKICLNHFISDKLLTISHKSLYNAQNYARLMPIMEFENGCYEKFFKSNDWIFEYLTNYSENSPNSRKKIKKSCILRIKAKLFEILLSGFMGDKLELFFKKIQSARIKKDFRTYKKGGRVTFNDNELEFHPDSPETKIIDKYNQIMLKFGYPELVEKDSGLL